MSTISSLVKLAAGLAVFLVAAPSFAQEPASPKKSIALAVLLGLDPIPGDALFYASRPVQGTVNLVVGTLGAVPFYAGLASLVRNRCGFMEDCGEYDGMASVAVLVGAAVYLPALVWDLVGGVHYIRKNNRATKSTGRFGHPSIEIARSGVIAKWEIKF